MRRIERLHAITNHLRARSPRRVPAAALAERFGVSRRTIERDLRSLVESGVPVYGTAGPAGGYAILPDHALPPLHLTAQEATACIAALRLLDRSPLSPHARTAVDKLRCALPASVAAAVAAMPLMSVPSPQARTTAAWLDAITGRRLVSLRYADDPVPRTVEPYATLEGGGSWYLVGWCRNRGGVRGFRTDRVTEIDVTAQTFEPVHGPDVATDLDRWQAAPLADG